MAKGDKERKSVIEVNSMLEARKATEGWTWIEKSVRKANECDGEEK